MAAELFIRTSKTEYRDEETIYGAVYLKVSGPTSAFGILMRFFGYENFQYRQVASSSGTMDRVKPSFVDHNDSKQYFPVGDLTLFEFDGPIALGEYAFPFYKKLPANIPSSTEIKWLHGRAEVVYYIETSLLGAEGISCSVKIVVAQPQISRIVASSNDDELKAVSGLPVQTSKVVEVHTAMPFFTSRLIITASIDKQEYHSGDNIKLKLRLDTTGLKPKVSQLSLQLMRETQLSSTKIVFTGQAKRSWSYSFGSATPGVRSIEKEAAIEFFYPEQHSDGRAQVVWDSGTIYDRDGTLLIRGIDELLIPLRDENRQDLPATTMGCLITILYAIKIEIVLQRNDPILLNLPVSCVWQRSNQCQQLRPVEWIHQCQVITSTNPELRVSDVILEKEYATLPSFHVQ